MTALPDAAPFVPRLLVSRPPDAARRWSAEATMVFVDISGFTSLSEQLARRGREGAEDLISTLTRIFTLLMSATDDGGDVIKFAGDALFVMYDGPEHALHACHAATAMQRLIRVVGGVRLAGARARLRMSVGIHTGTFEFLLTGNDQQNLVVCGPDLDRLLALQDRAKAGETLISRGVAALLPRSARGAENDLGVLLGRMPAVPSVGSQWRTRAMPGDIARFLPAPFQARPDLLDTESDHRRAAMAFVQLTGFGAHLEAGDALEKADALTSVVEGACRETGVVLLDTDAAKDGYRYLLTAGAPQGVEDPEGRLLRALLRITADGGPHVRAGAAAGQVFAGAVGAPFRKTYAVMGDTTNTAARLTSQAVSGEVLAHAAMLARSTTVFATKAHDPIIAKGKAEPLPVATVVELVGRRDRRDTAQRFVGRAPELATLRAALYDARKAHGSVIEVIGEAGIGKSRLVAEALGDSGLPQLTVPADPYGAAVPYRALTMLVRPLLGLTARDSADVARTRLVEVIRERAPDLEDWLPLLAPAAGTELPATQRVTDLDPRFRSARLRFALLALLDALITEPTVLLIEDAHWVDQTSADALAGAFADVSKRPWLVVLTRRDGDEGLRGTEGVAIQLRPSPMAAAEARDLVVAGSQRALRPAEVDEVLERGGGNPFFLLELATAPQSVGVLPDSVEELVGARIDNLDGGERHVLRQAAVLGSRFHADLYTGTTGLSTIRAAAESSQLAEFVASEADGFVAFRREIYREVAYQQLTFRRRRELHRDAAAAIERSPALAGDAWLPMLSLHFHAAGDWSNAFRCSRDAASEAQARYANDEAVVFCQRAIESGRRANASVDDLRAIYLNLGEVLNMTGRHEEAVRAYTKALRGVHEAADLAPIVYKIGMVRREEGRFAAALSAARRVRSLATALPVEERNSYVAEADLLAAGVRYWQGKSADCQRLTVEAVKTAESLPAGTTRTRLIARAYALHDSAVVELEGRAGQYGELPLKMFREIGDLYNEGRFCVNVAIGYYYEGQWDRAVEMYYRSLEIAERTGDVFSVAVAQMNIGELLAYQGKTTDACALLAESVTTLQAVDTPLAAAHAACFLGIAQRLAGDLEAARSSFDESARLFTVAGRSSGFSLDELATRRLELLVDEGELAGVEERGAALLIRDGGSLAHVHQVRLHRCLGLAYAASGRDGDAGRELDESLRISDEVASPYERALTLLAVAGTKEDGAARSEAAAILTSLGVSDIERVTPRIPLTRRAVPRS
jgi:class 3 adenylate cyclase/tetratricopeptide (TPR) repeat protein